jgi:hypothetical protein
MSNVHFSEMDDAASTICSSASRLQHACIAYISTAPASLASGRLVAQSRSHYSSRKNLLTKDQGDDTEITNRSPQTRSDDQFLIDQGTAIRYPSRAYGREILSDYEDQDVQEEEANFPENRVIRGRTKPDWSALLARLKEDDVEDESEINDGFDFGFTGMGDSVSARSKEEQNVGGEDDALGYSVFPTLPPSVYILYPHAQVGGTSPFRADAAFIPSKRTTARRYFSPAEHDDNVSESPEESGYGLTQEDLAEIDEKLRLHLLEHYKTQHRDSSIKPACAALQSLFEPPEIDLNANPSTLTGPHPTSNPATLSPTPPSYEEAPDYSPYATINSEPWGRETDREDACATYWSAPAAFEDYDIEDEDGSWPTSSSISSFSLEPRRATTYYSGSVVDSQGSPSSDGSSSPHLHSSTNQVQLTSPSQGPYTTTNALESSSPTPAFQNLPLFTYTAPFPPPRFRLRRTLPTKPYLELLAQIQSNEDASESTPRVPIRVRRDAKALLNGSARILPPRKREGVEGAFVAKTYASLQAEIGGLVLGRVGEKE